MHIFILNCVWKLFLMLSLSTYIYASFYELGVNWKSLLVRRTRQEAQDTLFKDGWKLKHPFVPRNFEKALVERGNCKNLCSLITSYILNALQYKSCIFRPARDKTHICNFKHLKLCQCSLPSKAIKKSIKVGSL